MKPQYFLRNPATDGMIVALAYVTPMPGTYVPNLHLLNRIFVPRNHRGHGFGSQLLKQICAEADREDVELWLSLEPDHDDDADWISAWYQRNGFVWGEDCMMRVPQPFTVGH